MGSVDVGVGLSKVCSNDGCEGLGRGDRVLLGEDIACLLLGISSDNDRVVCFGVTAKELIYAIRNSMLGLLTRSQYRPRGECRRSAQ